jgi:hypothetical protein
LRCFKKTNCQQSSNLEAEFQLDSTNYSNDFLLEYYLYKTIELGTTPQRPILHEEPLLYLYPKAYSILNQEGTSTTSMKNLDYEPYLMNSPKNLDSYFYVPSFSYQTLNMWGGENGLVNISQNLMRQGSISNTLRWAYRYNGLHRRSIINSHKLTEAKRLLSSGYFDSSATQNNLWFSDQYARDLTFKKRSNTLNSLQQLRSNWNLLYRSTFGYQNLTSTFKTPSSVTSADIFMRLSFYESSFHFFLNRIKFYSSLSNHSINSNPYLVVQDRTPTNNFDSVEMLYNTTKNTMLPNSKLLNLNVTNLSSKMSLTNEASSTSTTSLRDIILISKDSEIFTKKGAESITNLTKSLNLKGSFYKKFSYQFDNSKGVGLNLLTVYSQYGAFKNTRNKMASFKICQSKNNL